jgi:predicted  nucleic acid-binding Zn-ribbon protein
MGIHRACCPDCYSYRFSRYLNAFRSFITSRLSLACLLAGLLGGSACGIASVSTSQLVYAASGAPWGGGDGGGGGAGDHSTYTKSQLDTKFSNIEKAFAAIRNQQSIDGTTIASLQSTVSSYATHFANIEQALSDIRADLGRLHGFDANATTHFDNLEKALTDIRTDLGKLHGFDANATTHFDNLEKALTDIRKDIGALHGFDANATTHFDNLEKALTDIRKDIGTLHGFDATVTDHFTNIEKALSDLRSYNDSSGKRFANIEKAFSDIRDAVGKNASDNASQSKSLSDISGSVSGLSARLVSLETLPPTVNLLQTSVSDLSKTVNSALDTSAVVHAIDVVRDVVSKWSDIASAHYKVVRDIKAGLDVSLQKILEKLISIDNHLIGYQAVWVDNWKNFTVGYDGYQKFWAQNFSNFSENWLKGLEITTTWLQSIYNAITGLQLTSPPTIVTPPAGTEQPAGTNFWDVLKQLIKSVADAVGKLVDAVSHLLDNLSDLLKSLFVPKDTKFLDSSFKSISTKVNTKFKFFISFGDAVKNVFSSRKAISDVSFTFQDKAVSIDLSWLRTLARMIRPYATGAFLISSIIGLYRRITGGDVVQ